MSLLNVDLEKCIRDRICSAECSFGLIEFKEPDSFPTSIENAEKLCLSCGHCIAACPKNALSLTTLPPENMAPVGPALMPTAEQAETFLKSRRSIRHFKDKPVDRSLIEKMIDIARYAPSGHNLQPVHWMVIDDRAAVCRLAELVVDWMRYMITNVPEFAGPIHMDRNIAAWEVGKDRVLHGAPVVVLAHAPANLPVSIGSCTIALAYLELAAYSLNLGACWAGFLGMAAGHYPPLAKELFLPEGHQVFGAIMIGYPQYAYYRIPPRTKARITWK